MSNSYRGPTPLPLLLGQAAHVLPHDGEIIPFFAHVPAGIEDHAFQTTLFQLGNSSWIRGSFPHHPAGQVPCVGLQMVVDKFNQKPRDTSYNLTPLFYHFSDKTQRTILCTSCFYLLNPSMKDISWCEVTQSLMVTLNRHEVILLGVNGGGRCGL